MNTRIHPAGVLLSMLIGYVFGLLLLGIICGALFGVVGLATYMVTVRSLDNDAESA